jgi:outer membrane lipoprotein carrier protein
MKCLPNLKQPLDGRQMLALLITAWAIFCGLGFAASAAWAAVSHTNPPVEEYVRDFESSYRAVQTLRADFTQTYTWGGRTRVESGTVYFAQRGRMRWDYLKPNEKLFLSDGKQVLLYIPAENQLTRSAVKSSADVRVPFRLLLSRLSLRKVFARIEFADSALSHAPADRVLRGVPKKEYEEDYRDVLMELTPSFDVRRLVISYPDNSVMEFRFDRIERDVPLSGSLFRFSPPPGTEIIEQ